MSLNYDQPTSSDLVLENIGKSSTFSSTTNNAISSLLNLNVPNTPVVVGSMDATGAVTSPSGQETQLVVVDIPGTTPTTVTIPEAQSTNPVWIFDTDADVTVRFNTVPRVIMTGRGNDDFTVAGDANTTIESAGGNDTITTSGGDDIITIQARGNSSVSTGAGNDTILAGTGNDTIDAGSGIDVVSFANSRAVFTGSINADNVMVSSADGDTLMLGVERVHFSDKKYALDLEIGQNAAMSLQIINVVGAEARNDPTVVGTILEMFDAGHDLKSVAQHALDAGWVTQFAGSTSNNDVAKMAFKNIFGAEPNESQLDWALSYMDGRTASYTQAEFIATAAQIDENNDIINLVGLQQSGVEFI